MGKSQPNNIQPDMVLGQIPANIDIIVDGSGPDGQFVCGTDDIKLSIKKTLADYLSISTNANTYKVDSGYSEISAEDSHGNPAAIITGGNNSDVFAHDLESWASTFLDNNAESIKTADYLSKGKPVDNGTETGHTLLSKIKGAEGVGAGSHGSSTSVDRPGKQKVEYQISQVLQSNRFNPTPGSSPFVENGIIEPVIGKFRTDLGTYSRDQDAKDANTTNFKSIGESLMLMASGDVGEHGPHDPATSAGLFLGSGVQIGSKRLTKTDMDIRRTFSMKGIDRVALESDISQNDGDPSYYSHGQVNNPSAPFSGFVPIGMLALGTTMVTTLVVGSEIVFSLLGLITSTNEKDIRMSPGPYTLGESGNPSAAGLSAALLSPQALGLVKTENNYFLAARRGVTIFFGFEGNNIANASQNALTNMIQSPGYYVTVIRSVTRSLNTLSNAFRDVDMSNPVQGAQSIIGIVDVIKSTKIISFFNACATLGDIAINEDFAEITNALANGQTTRLSKSRENDGPSNLSLAWRSSSSPAMYILPKSVINASQDFGTNNASILRGTLGSYAQDKFKATNKARLSSKDVEVMEDSLESEYVPFYFHDLRTNEVISLHAFLATLNESFNANYESVEGYGRIDPVRIYKNTERTIDFSFHIAATSEEDFDEMWWKINKLITLLYPQWGKGRQLSNGEAKFIQPFSQIPTASPLIRLRIGDVIKTNSSKFNLARLFGMGNKDSFELSKYFTSSDIQDSDIVTIKNRITDMLSSPDVPGINPISRGFQVGDKAILRITQGGYYVEETGKSSAADSVVKAAITKLGLGSTRRKVKLIVDEPVTIMNRQTKYIDKPKKIFAATFSNEISTDRQLKTVYTVKLTKPISGDTHGDIELLEVTHDDLKIDASWVILQSNLLHIETNPLNSGLAELSVKAIIDFFSTEKNFVMKSFESTGGRGLAGVITNMSMDWSTPTWETSKGKRAPKYCTINMNFSPIHDIPPGIDESGFNRAPIYNVGSIAGEIAGDIYDKKKE